MLFVIGTCFFIHFYIRYQSGEREVILFPIFISIFFTHLLLQQLCVYLHGWVCVNKRVITYCEFHQCSSCINCPNLYFFSLHVLAIYGHHQVNNFTFTLCFFCSFSPTLANVCILGEGHMCYIQCRRHCHPSPPLCSALAAFSVS
jgi:hypothetical protein